MDDLKKVEILKSLADGTRLSVVHKLAHDGCEMLGSDLVGGCSQVLKLSQPTLSHHLNRLVRSGVLQARKVGTEKHYCLNTELLLSIGVDPQKI